jgi:hypothetical protein
MVIKETVDPLTIIEEQGNDYVIYKDLQSGERWIIKGECNQCGLCALGEVNNLLVWTDGIKPGQPMACFDLRKTFGLRNDVPLRPEAATEIQNEIGKCCLEGEYL